MRPSGIRTPRFGWLVLSLGFLGLATGCPFGDPGLGVAGDLELGATADASGFAYLEIRAFQDDNDSWDPTQAVPEVEWAFTESRALTGTDDFPTGYNFSSLGTVDKRRWRVLAWLSRESGSVAPATGDWWGTARFSFDGCGSFGGFCDHIGGVDIVIDAQVP